jgi:hypothetical protein
MTAAVVAQKDKSLTQILNERHTALLDLKLSLEEFNALVEVSYDERWRWHSWRVEGDINIYYWIYDHIIHNKEHTEMLSDEQVLKCAYKRFCDIQERRGQVNFHNVYVQDCEDIELFPRKNLDHATVRVVKDKVDGLYRFSTDYHVGNGGTSYAPWFGETIEIYKSKNDAILEGARQIISSIEDGWEAKAKPETYNPFINKIQNYIENLKAEIRQPSLFG